jgi:uncharacterized membrane protein
MGARRLRCLWQLVFALLLAAFPATAETSYLFHVTDYGETTVTIELTEPAVLELPPDVTAPEVEGGTITSQGKRITVQPGERAIVSYASSYYTRKEEGVWYFEAGIPRADTITVVLPQAVHVVQSIPRAAIVKADSWQLSWEDLGANISVSYVRIAEAAASRQAMLRLPEFSGNTFIAGLLIALALAGLGAYLFWRKRQAAVQPRQVKPRITEGQLNIIRAANQNEALVLQIVLKHNGYIKRNALERESQLSKSSLASTLKNLERKNIIAIDRMFFVHHISLTSWFKSLE